MIPVSKTHKKMLMAAIKDHTDYKCIPKKDNGRKREPDETETLMDFCGHPIVFRITWLNAINYKVGSAEYTRDITLHYSMDYLEKHYPLKTTA